MLSLIKKSQRTSTPKFPKTVNFSKSPWSPNIWHRKSTNARSRRSKCILCDGAPWSTKLIYILHSSLKWNFSAFYALSTPVAMWMGEIWLNCWIRIMIEWEWNSHTGRQMLSWASTQLVSQCEKHTECHPMHYLSFQPKHCLLGCAISPSEQSRKSV